MSGASNAATVRVYLPVVRADLAALHAGDELDAGRPAHAVTPALREWYTEGDVEELEFVAYTEAGLACLHLIAAGGPLEPRRVVLALDVDAGAVRPDPAARHRSGVRLNGAVTLTQVVSVHVDEADAAEVVREAVAALPAADAGDDDARFAVDEAEATELLWFDVSEIADLL